MKNNTFTKTSFDYCFPVNKQEANNELTHLDQTIKDLKKEAKRKNQFFKI